MKNIKYIILAIIGFMFVTSSCSDGKEIDQTLEVGVENHAVTMDNTSQTKVIPVKVDKGTLFTATWDGGEWGRTELREGGFAIILDANTTFYDRNASVTVTLEGGWKNDLVKVTQYGSDPELSVLPSEVKFDFMGGEDKIVVATLSDSWTAKSSVEWLKVTPHAKTGEILITVDKNSGDRYEDVLARSTIITVNSGRASKEVFVSQDEGAYFIFPYDNYDNFTKEAMQEFELARYSTLSISSTAYDLVGTQSTLFPVMQYYLDGMGRGAEAMLGQGHSHSYFETDEFKKLMELEGFEFIGVSSGVIYNYWKETAGRTLNVHAIIRSDKPGIITFFPLAKKPVIETDAPTFDEIPLLDPALNWGISVDAVKSWEEANGGTLAHEEATQIEYRVPGSDVHLLRVYAFDKAADGGGLRGVLYVFKEIEKIITYNLTLPMINNKFVALLKAGGFFFDKQVGSTQDYMYVNKELDLAIIIGLAVDAGVNYPTLTYITPSRVVGVSPQLELVMPSYLYSPKGDFKSVDKGSFVLLR